MTQHNLCSWQWALPKKDMTQWTVICWVCNKVMSANKHTHIETSTTRKWFKCSLRKQLIHLHLNNWMMSCSCLQIKLPEVTEQGRCNLNWKWWPWTILITNLLEVMLIHWSKKIRKHTNLKNWGWGWWGGYGLTHQECWPPQPSFILESAELADRLLPTDFLPPGWVSVPLSKWGLLAKEAPLDPGTGLFCTFKWNPVCGLFCHHS